MTEATNGKVSEAFAALESGIESFVTGDDWRAMLARMAKRGRFAFSRFSFMNQVICWAYRPKSAYIATFNGWKSVGRFPRKGTGFSILRPNIRMVDKLDSNGNPMYDASGKRQKEKKLVGFLALTVFAYEDTDGAEVDFSLPIPQVDNVEVFENCMGVLRDVALNLDGGKIVSSFEFRARMDSDVHRTASGWYSKQTKGITVIDSGNKGEDFATAVHELAHAILHPAGEHHSQPEMEVEAESVSFVVCTALGMDCGKASFPYVANWAGKENPQKAVQASGKRISAAATTILDAIYASLGQATETEEESSAAA